MKTLALTTLLALGLAAPSFAMEKDSVHNETAQKIFAQLKAESLEDE